MTVATTLNWQSILDEEQQKPYFKQLMKLLEEKHEQGKVIYPPQPEIFTALKLAPYENIKVVMLGQDPYHGPNQAHGLSFSVKPSVRIPPSLSNMFEELNDDLGIPKPKTGYLTQWATQGVLMLNCILTVEAGRPQSHANIGWQTFTDRIISSLNEHPNRIVFLLWGSYAQRKVEIIDTERHFILKAPHPSPLSAHRGFFGCKHFSRTNQFLESTGQTPIDWRLDNENS